MKSLLKLTIYNPYFKSSLGLKLLESILEISTLILLAVCISLTNGLQLSLPLPLPAEYSDISYTLIVCALTFMISSIVCSIIRYKTTNELTLLRNRGLIDLQNKLMESISASCPTTKPTELRDKAHYALNSSAFIISDSMLSVITFTGESIIILGYIATAFFFSKQANYLLFIIAGTVMIGAFFNRASRNGTSPDIDVFKELSNATTSYFNKIVSFSFYPLIESYKKKIMSLAFAYACKIKNDVEKKEKVSLAQDIFTISVMTLFLISLGTDKKSFASMLIFLGIFFKVVPKIVQVFRDSLEIKAGIASLDSLTYLTDEINNFNDEEQKIKYSLEDYNIEIINGKFRYSRGKDDHLLVDINLIIPQGSKIALIGRSGTGKSTLLNILSRNTNLTTGTYLVNTIDSKEITRQALKKHIGYVNESNAIFEGTLFQNITCLDDESFQNENLVSKIIEQVDLNNLIEHEKYGIHYFIKDDGVNLSLGQKQKIMIARALYKRPKVLILDEATSNIDMYSEQAIYEAILKDYPTMTIIAVTHRLSSINWADKIYEISNGRLHADPHIING